MCSKRISHEILPPYLLYSPLLALYSLRVGSYLVLYYVLSKVNQKYIDMIDRKCAINHKSKTISKENEKKSRCIYQPFTFYQRNS